jgi:hypothetical protein
MKMVTTIIIIIIIIIKKVIIIIINNITITTIICITSQSHSIKPMHSTAPYRFHLAMAVIPPRSTGVRTPLRSSHL